VDFDNLFILIIIFSFVARAIGEAMKAGKKGPGQQPGQRPQRPGLPQQRQELPQQRTGLPQQQGEQLEHPSRFPVERAPVEAPAQKQSQEELAAEMIPDELWRILTGQPKPRSAQVPAPQQQSYEADVDEELERYEEGAAEGWGAGDLTREDREAEQLIERREEAALEYSRAPETYQPVVVSLETDPAPTPIRHAAFHKKIDQAQVLPGFTRRQAPSITRLAGAGPQALRRAVLMQEILGKPKGLE
jgi:hypothetical protein